MGFCTGLRLKTIPIQTTLAALLIALAVDNVICLHAAEHSQTTDSDVGIVTSVEKTLETNPRLSEIKQNREAVIKDLRQTRGGYYPRVDLNAGYGTDSHSDPLTRSRDDEYDFEERAEASLTLVQPLYQGGETTGLVEKQQAKLDSINHRVYDNAESLALDAIIAHLEVWRQRRLLELAEQNIDTHEKILDHIDERQRAGAGSSADVVQTQGRLALTRSSRAQIAGALESARANYYRLVGLYPGELLVPVNFHQVAPPGADEAIAIAQGCNPKLAAFGADIRAARGDVDVAKSGFLPKVNLELSSTYEDKVESSTSYSHNNAAMVRARWNLFNGGSDTAARDAAASRRLQLVEARKDQYEKIEEQIRDTWSQYQISGQQVKTYSDAVRYNRQTRDAYQEQFVVGQRSLLDVLDSENELFQSSGQLVTARANEIIAVYRMLALKGCLLRSLGVDTKAHALTPVSNKCCTIAWQGGGNVDVDGDGVPNARDRCPGTSSGVVVDEKGCPKPRPVASRSAQKTASGTWIYKDIQFETNSWEIRPEANLVLDEIAGWLNAKPKLVVEIQGHTDTEGERGYNIDLSRKRAQAIVDYLKQKGVPEIRMQAKGYGPDRPIAGNDTAEGRSKNRRVEIKPINW